MKNHLVISIAAVVLLSGCATPVAKPAFYPNAHYQRVGPAQAQADAQFCDELAQQSDVKAVNKVDAGRAAAAGAAGVGTAGVVGSVLNGGKPNLKNIAAGAAAIGAGGAAAIPRRSGVRRLTATARRSIHDRRRRPRAHPAPHP